MPEEINMQNYSQVQKLRWLVIAGVFLFSIGLTGFIAYTLGKANVPRVQQQQACRKFNRGKFKAVDVASAGLIPGVKDVLAELEKVQIELVKTRTRFTDQAPPVINVKNQEAALNSLLEQRIKGICQVIQEI